MEGSGCCPHHPLPGELPQETGSVVVVEVVAAAVAAAVMPVKLGPGPEPEPGPLPLPLPPLALVVGDQEGCVCAYVS